MKKLDILGFTLVIIIIMSCIVYSLSVPETTTHDIQVVTNTRDTNWRIKTNRISTPVHQEYSILNHSTFDSTQEQIRDEIFYGDLELLAQLIQAEAGNQDLMGKKLVADVVLNRVDVGFENNVEMVIYQSNQFTSIYDGNFDEAAYNMTESDYLAAYTEMTGERIDYDIIYFSAEGYSKYGTPAYPYGDHYFSTR